MGILNDEIFGLVLPIVPYPKIDDAGPFNAGERPLGLPFGGNGKDRRKVLERTTSGNVDQRHAAALRAGRPAVRRCRRQRHGCLPR